MAALETLQNVLNVTGCIASQDENSNLPGEEMAAPVEKYSADNFANELRGGGKFGIATKIVRTRAREMVQGVPAGSQVLFPAPM